MSRTRLLARLPLALLAGIVILAQGTNASPSHHWPESTVQSGRVALHAPDSPRTPGPAIDPAGIRRWTDQAFELYQQGQVQDALMLYFLAATTGDRTALYNAAVIRITGESDSIITLEMAVEMLQASSQAGFAPAQFGYALLLESGNLVARDPPAAKKWFLSAAQQGHAEAARALATCYYLGRGSPQDYPQAAHWFEVAAMAGDVGAQYVLASMFETGLGVEIDLERALQWYGEAARQGDVLAGFKEREIAARLAWPKAR